MNLEASVVSDGPSVTRININFHDIFPVSKRFIIRRSFKATLRLLTFFVTVGMVVLALRHFWAPIDDVLAYKWLAAAGIVLVGCLVFAFKVWYEYMYRRSLEFGITRDNFYLKRGVFMQDVGSFPLSRITDIYLERKLSDYILNLASLVIATPSAKSVQFARIDGLRHRDAEMLKELLGSVVHKGPEGLGEEPLFLEIARRNGLTVGELKILLSNQSVLRPEFSEHNRARSLVRVPTAA